MHFLPSLIVAVFIGTVIFLEEANCGDGYASGRSNYGSGNSNDVRYAGNYGGSGYPQRMGTGPGGAVTVYDYLGINNEGKKSRGRIEQWGQAPPNFKILAAWVKICGFDVRAPAWPNCNPFGPCNGSKTRWGSLYRQKFLDPGPNWPTVFQASTVPYYTAMFKEMNNFAVTGGMGTIGLGDQVLNLNGPYLNQIYGGSLGPDYGGSASYGNGRTNYGRDLGANSGASNGGSFGRRQNSFW